MGVQNDIRDDFVSGIAVGTLFTLFVVPAVYMLIAADHHDKPEPVTIREQVAH